MDGGGHRVRGPPARVHLDQGVQSAVQRQVPRRQDVPVSRGDARRSRPPGDDHPQPEHQGRTLLRAVHEGLGDPRDGRPHAEGVPDAKLLRRRLPPRRADRPSLPARRHRQVRGAVRRPDHAGGPQIAGDRLRLLHGGKRQRLPARSQRQDEAGREHHGLRVRRSAPGCHPGARGRARQERGRADRERGRRRLRHRARRARRSGDAVHRPRRSRPRCPQLGGRQGARRRPRRAGRDRRPERLRRTGRTAAGDHRPRASRGHGRAGAVAHAAPPRDPRPVGRARPAHRPCRAEDRAARREGRAGADRRDEREERAHPLQDPAQLRLRRALEGAQRHPGRPRDGGCSAADGVLRRLAPQRHEHRRLDGRLRGRPAAQGPVPPLQHPRVHGRHRVDLPGHLATAGLPEGCAVPAEAADAADSADEAGSRTRWTRTPRSTRRARPGPTRWSRRPPSDGAASSRTRRTCSSWTADSLRSPPPSGRSTSRACTGIQLAGIAKRLEEIWLPDSDFPVILPRNSDALFLIQRLRDEAHRFAITYQRARRKRDIGTVLGEIPGLGPVARQGAAEALRVGGAADARRRPEQIAEVRGVGIRTATAVFERLAETGRGDGDRADVRAEDGQAAATSR